MAWTYSNWVMYNILVGLGIVLFTYFILGILLWRSDQTFYNITAKLFNITRCIIDVNHNILRRNSAIFTTSSEAVKVSRERETIPDDTEILSTNSIQHRLRQTKLGQAGTHVHDILQRSGFIGCCWPRTVGGNDFTVPSAREEQSTIKKEAVSQNHPSHPEYEREVLDVYGKYLTLNKKRNKFLVMTLAVIVISSVIIAGFQGCFLANITVYPNDLCPYYGVMECYHGSNFTYFRCTPNRTIDFPLFASSATCFRWTERATISDVMTQIGACTGLLTAFGSVVEFLLRLLLFVFQQRPSVATGIRRMMEKTVGINRITKPSRCCGCTVPFHFGILDLRLYQRPCLVIILFIIYTCLPAIAIVSVILLSYFRISVTSLTYVILITVVMICCLGLLWILWEEDEVGKIVPGGWISISDMSGTVTRNLKQSTTLLHGLVPEEDLKSLQNVIGVVEQVKNHTDEVLVELNSHVDDVIAQLTRRIQSILPKSEVEKLTRFSQDISSETLVFKERIAMVPEIPARGESKTLEDKEETI